jgi:two-component system OmpR family response regulator
MLCLEACGMKQILVVDDDDGTVEVVAEMLRDAGYAPQTASTGDQALLQVRRSRPDLLLIDLIMPDMDGWELLARLRDDAELASLPAVVITAWPLTTNLPDDVLVLRKPFEWETLLSTIRQLA